MGFVYNRIMNKKKILLSIVFLSVGLGLMAQEDTHFSQGVFNQAYVNPAVAGSTDLFLATGVVRMEMLGFDGAPTNSILNVNGPIDVLHGGVTLSLYSDKIGYYTMPGFSLGYSFRFPLWKGNFALGLSAGLVNGRIDASSWRFPDGSGSSDGAVPIEKESAISPDFGAGAYYNDDRLFLGLSVMHLNKPKVTKVAEKSTLPQVLYVTGGYRFTLNNPDFDFRPSAYLSSDFAITQLTLNAHMFYREKLWGGLSYRLNEAVVGMLGFELFEGIKISYSYDFITSKARVGSNGAHEILVSYGFSISTEKRKQQNRSVRYL